MVDTENPMTRVVALFGLYTFYFSQPSTSAPSLYSVKHLALPIGMWTLTSVAFIKDLSLVPRCVSSHPFHSCWAGNPRTQTSPPLRNTCIINTIRLQNLPNSPRIISKPSKSHHTSQRDLHSGRRRLDKYPWPVVHGNRSDDTHAR